MSRTLRRRITWISLAVDGLLLIVVVVSRAFFHHSRDWGAGLTAIAFIAVSIVASLLYLRSIRGKS